MTSNAYYAISGACGKAAIAAYKSSREKDQQLSAMWERSVDTWCDIAANMIFGAVVMGSLKPNELPEA